MDPHDMLFDYVDRFRSLLPSSAWQGLARDLAKNDVLALLHLHRVRSSRMGDLAAYLDAPLNTCDGGGRPTAAARPGGAPTQPG